MQTSVIITAGGTGKRMGSSIPKQFLEIGGEPILMHSIKCFEHLQDCQVLVTLPKDWWDHWFKLCELHSFNSNYLLIEGGVERYDSVKNALLRATGEIIGIHDGVRPFVSQSVILDCYNLCLKQSTAIPAIPLKNSIRKGNLKVNNAQNRSDFLSIQTPQFFKREIIVKAYQLAYTPEITDDASLVEKAGFPIHCTLGNEENIKITTPFDRKIAEILLKQ